MAHCSENEHVEGLAASTDTSLLEQYWARTTAVEKIDQQSPTAELQQPVSGRGAGHQGRRWRRSTVLGNSGTTFVLRTTSGAVRTQRTGQVPL